MRYAPSKVPIEMMNDEALLRLECACLKLLLKDGITGAVADGVYLKLCRIRAVRFEGRPE